MKKKHERIMSALLNEPWLIQASWLEKIIAIAQGEGDIEALRSKRSEALEDTRQSFIRDNVSHIPVTGPIFPRANLMTEMSGATSVVTLANDFQAALDNSDVKEIIMDVDSPGGAVTGINELGNMIRNSPKPVTTYVGGTAASAGYWIGSSADEIVIDDTARLGSIGVVMAIPKPDDTKVEIVSSISPDKRPDVTTDEGKGVLQREVDALADVFVSTIARNRGVTEEFVLANFGKGGVLVGKDAVEAGMADRLGSFEGLMTEKTQTDTGGSTMLTMDQMQKDHPDLYQAILDKGAKAGRDESEGKISTLTTENTRLTQENTTLQTENESLTTENTETGKRLLALEKSDDIRTEKDIKNKSSEIVISKLGASSIPARMHPKVRKQLDHNAYVVDGKFDTIAFGEHVDTEILSWEEDLSADDVVQGVGGIGAQEGANASSDEVADRLFNAL